MTALSSHALRDGRDLAGIEFVESRVLLRRAPLARLALGPGDRSLVTAGETVAAGSPIAERLRAAVAAELPAAALGRDSDPAPGDRWVGTTERRHRLPGSIGTLLFESGGRWRLAVAEHADAVEAPAAGIVRDARSGVAIVVELAGTALPGRLALGGWTRGRLEIAAEADGELRPGNLDVGRAGTILVLGSRADAETLIRARAMGIRGVVVASMASKDVRDFRASEIRLRASIHRPPAFAVLVLDGHVRRPIAGPFMAILDAIAGREASIVDDPPMIVFDDPEGDLPVPPADHVRARAGIAAGREGRWLGVAGVRQFEAGVHLEAGVVQFIGTDRPSVVPLADLERFEAFPR